MLRKKTYIYHVLPTPHCSLGDYSPIASVSIPAYHDFDICTTIGSAQVVNLSFLYASSSELMVVILSSFSPFIVSCRHHSSRISNLFQFEYNLLRVDLSGIYKRFVRFISICFGNVLLTVPSSMSDWQSSASFPTTSGASLLNR